ncbi:hypothetical protein POM88_011182 [Heracleum sosnowskyi]|uniref:Membrane protein of ER body-like protein n=1 Tax=Heracleum sosnowskyi TaxID=360622 RepID=A0AAD8IWI6_9APIA|nr:hypothetical protein POM88_011182 [Heracleum sosnowskyi]
MKNVDINDGGVDDLVYALPAEELQSSDHGGLKVSQVELKEKETEVDSKCSERCVYYQNDEGLWKCRKCCWTFQSERVPSDDIQNSKQPLHKPTHFQTVNQQGSFFSYETEGTGCSGGQLSSGQSSIKHTGQEEIHGDRKLDVTKESLDMGQHLSQESEVALEKQLEHDRLSGSNLLPSEISPDEDNKNFKFSAYKEIGSGDTSLLHETDREETEVDVERVLREQDTHDLYCPNCKSCITKRVIIRKRKRRLSYSSEDGKHNKLEEGTGSDPNSTSVATTSIPSPITVDTCLDVSAAPTSNNCDQDQEPDVFRCLSCFSIFIPAGNGFKLLGMSGDRRGEVNLQDHPQTPIAKKSWFFTLFLPDRNVETDDTEVLIPKVSAIHESSSHAPTNYGREPVKTGAEGSTEGGIDNLPHQKVSLGKPGGHEYLEDQVSMIMNKQIGDTSEDEAPSPEINADGEIVQSEIKSREGGDKVVSPSSKRFIEYDIHLVGSGELSDTLLSKNKGNDFKLLGVSGDRRDGDNFHDHPQTSIVKKSWLSTLFQSDRIGEEMTAETCQVEPLAAQRVQDLTDPAETGNLQDLETRIQIIEQRGTSTDGIQGVEIIKSIVYGGLVESVTSLVVVSSAASSNVTTLNVFALGLANLIGGLFIIGHDLWDLKNDQKAEASDQSAEQIDQYHEVLGRRRNFLLHAVLAILSYLTFGLIPPAVYGFSFQRSDDRDLKLLAVAAVALLGIIILAAGKAYVQRAPRSYVKTIAYYVVTALMASGVSYAAGDLINMFLEKFGVFQSSLIVTVAETPVPGRPCNLQLLEG